MAQQGILQKLLATPKSSVWMLCAWFFLMSLSTYAAGGDNFTSNGLMITSDKGVSGFSFGNKDGCQNANFTWQYNNTDCCMQFTYIGSTDCGVGSGWTWDFGDGTPNLIAVHSPCHVYAQNGTYTVTLTIVATCHGFKTCSSTYPVSVTLPPPPPGVYTEVLSDYNGSDITCPGAADGIAAVYGYPSNYTLEHWDDPANSTTDTVYNLPAGTYNVTFVNADYCHFSIPVTVTDPGPIVPTPTVNSLGCFGDSVGIVNAATTGGTPPYTYVWNTPNSDTTATVTGLKAGVYKVTVNDANGCPAVSDSVVLSEPPPVTATATVITNYNGSDISCYNGSDGGVQGYGSGGVGGYTYVWNDSVPGTQDSIVNGLSLGTYTVTVADANGCSTTTNVIVNQPPPLLLNVQIAADYNGQNVSCFGASDGAANALPTGGTPPYTYQWNDPDAQITQIATGLAAGNYNVTVTDLNGCTVAENITLTEPPPIIPQSAVISDYNGADISCFGYSDGAVEAEAVGGTGTLTYTWNDGPPQTVDTIASGLPSGTYTVTVNDLNGCTATSTVTLEDPPVIDPDAQVYSDYNGEDISCYQGSDGEAIGSAVGGTGAYTYVWNDVNSTKDSIVVGLPQGTYTVTVTDANGCADTAMTSLFHPTQVVANALVTSDYNGQDISCFGGSDGQVTVNTVGGTPAYTYLWNDTDSQTTMIADSVVAGTYIVTVTDLNGCVDTAVVTVTQPPELVSNAFVTSDYNGEQISCYGYSDGTAAVNATGGWGTYTYVWSDPDSTTTPPVSGLAAGTYYISITDINGCVKIDSVTVSQPDELIASSNVETDYNGEDISCTGFSDGAVRVTATGGTEPFVYLWNTNQTTDLINHLPAGTYYATVTDANGCTDTTSVPLVDPPPLATLIGAVDVTCYGYADGVVEVIPNGGVPQYQYVWNTSPAQFNSVINTLSPGIYEVTITDANSCTITASTLIKEPDPIVVTLPELYEIPLGGDTILFPSSNANIAYYEWEPKAYLDCDICTSPVTAPPQDMLYTVVGYDESGCYDAAVTQVKITGRLIYVPNAFTPNGDGLNDLFRVYAKGVSTVRLKIFDRWGTKLYETEDINGGWDGTYKGELLNPGVYVYTVHLTFIDGVSTNRKGSVTLIR